MLFNERRWCSVKETYHFGVLDILAMNNGYKNKMELLRDYSFIPTVMMPRHKKIEIIPLLWKHIISKKR